MEREGGETYLLTGCGIIRGLIDTILRKKRGKTRYPNTPYSTISYARKESLTICIFFTCQSGRNICTRCNYIRFASVAGDIQICIPVVQVVPKVILTSNSMEC